MVRRQEYERKILPGGRLFEKILFAQRDQSGETAGSR